MTTIILGQIANMLNAHLKQGVLTPKPLQEVQEIWNRDEGRPRGLLTNYKDWEPKQVMPVQYYKDPLLHNCK